MKTLEEKIAVMQAYADGKTILLRGSEFKMKIDSNLDWDWATNDYTIKPEEPEVDWSKVTVDTPILVRDSFTEKWHKRYFAEYSNSRIYAWVEGTTSRTANGSEDYSAWAVTKLDPEAPSIINWIPNTGEAPEYKLILAILEDGEFRGPCPPYHLSWSKLALHPGNVKKYCILE